MALSSETKSAIKAKLRLGTTPKDIAEQLEVKVQTVYALKKIVEKEKEDEISSSLNEIPMELITHVVEEAKKDKELPALDMIVDGAEGLKKLDKSFQSTVTAVLTRFDKIAKDETTELKELKLILDTSANAYEKIFSSGTNIHIGDNNSHSNQQLTVFQNKKGV